MAAAQDRRGIQIIALLAIGPAAAAPAPLRYHDDENDDNEEMAPRTGSIASEPKAMVVVGEEARALNAWAA